MTCRAMQVKDAFAGFKPASCRICCEHLLEDLFGRPLPFLTSSGHRVASRISSVPFHNPRCVDAGDDPIIPTGYGEQLDIVDRHAELLARDVVASARYKDGLGSGAESNEFVHATRELT